MTDEEILSLFWKRDEAAIAQTEQKYGKACRILALRILDSESDAEECVYDAYMALWNSIPPLRPESLAAYLFGIARNISIKKYRASIAQKRSRQYEVSLEELHECLPSANTVEDLSEEKELKDCINRFLEKSKSVDRIIFVQRYWLCLEVWEIAENLGESRNYINVHLHRLKKKLKKYLEKEGYM